MVQTMEDIEGFLQEWNRGLNLCVSCLPVLYNLLTKIILLGRDLLGDRITDFLALLEI